MKICKKTYIAPQLTSVSFIMERGYSQSALTSLWDFSADYYMGEPGAEGVESYITHDSWTAENAENSNGFWGD